MSGKKNPNLGDKLRQERQGAENTLRDSRNKAADSSMGDSSKKKAEHRRQIRHEADLAKMRSKKLKSEQEIKAKKNAAASGKKGAKPKKPVNLAADALSAKAHQSVRNADQDNNSGVEAAHFTEGSAEGAARAGSRFQYGRKLRQYKKLERLEKKADKDAVDSIFTERMKSDPQAGSNLFSRWRQKQAIKKEYAAAKAGNGARNTVKASETTAKAAKRAAEGSKKAGSFFVRHKKGFLIAGGIAAAILLLMTCISSCSTLFQGGLSGVAASTYPLEDADMLAAEAAYCAMEDELREYLHSYESTHDYDEYHFDLDEIEHDPYVLISILSALHEGVFTIDQVQGDLQTLFDKQYILTETVTTETRYRTETRTDSEGNTYTVRVPYTWTICTVTLENFDLSHVPVYMMGEEQLSLYATYMSTLGNRPDLFPSSGYVNKYIDNPPTAWEIPAEYLTDERFNTLITEAEKYLGYPYVWGGSSPSTSFDCSGFVSYVLTNSGLCNTGRLGAQGLYNISTPVSDPQPGDLVFFVGTYDTTGVSHVGIYVGDGMMLHCGDPIQYSNLNTSYWQSHFYCVSGNTA